MKTVTIPVFLIFPNLSLCFMFPIFIEGKTNKNEWGENSKKHECPSTYFFFEVDPSRSFFFCQFLCATKTRPFFELIFFGQSMAMTSASRAPDGRFQHTPVANNFLAGLRSEKLHHGFLRAGISEVRHSGADACTQSLRFHPFRIHTFSCLAFMIVFRRRVETLVITCYWLGKYT
jgi:hypothetical protein